MINFTKYFQIPASYVTKQPELTVKTYFVEFKYTCNGDVITGVRYFNTKTEILDFYSGILAKSDDIQYSVQDHEVDC